MTGLRGRLGLGLSVASVRPPLPAEVLAPPAAWGRKGGRAGTLLQLGRGRKEAGRAKNVRKRLFTRGRGRLPRPAPGPPPPKVDQELWPAPCEAAGGHLAGGVRALSPAELSVVEARPARVRRPRPPLRAEKILRRPSTLLRRNMCRWPPESGPHSLETAPEASQPRGRVLPFFLAFMEMSVSDFLHKPQTSASHSHTEE